MAVHKNINLFILVTLCQAPFANGQFATQWRGPHRNGYFPEYHLSKSWPVNGPRLLWKTNELGQGYSSPVISEKHLFITGKKNDHDCLTVLDLDGNILWEKIYGQSSVQAYPETRCTPAVEDHFIYLISGAGEVVCINIETRKISWMVSALDKYEGIAGVWGIAESPLLVDEKVIYTPGGHLTTLIALDKRDGTEIWRSKSVHDSTAFVSPILVKTGLNKIIVNVLQHFMVGVDAVTGHILWKVNYSEIHPPRFHALAPRNNCVTPLYYKDRLYITSGYNHVGAMFELLRHGTEIQLVWVDSTLDNHHGQVVKVGDYIYGSNWIDNRNGNWCCINWESGKTEYETHWYNKGSISAADEMLYCYEEKKGHLALVSATPDSFLIKGCFQITDGNGPHWASPVIAAGRLYIRHDQYLMAYDIKNP